MKGKKLKPLEGNGKAGQTKGREGKGMGGNGRQVKWREGKGMEGNGRQECQMNEREGNGREWKCREGKGINVSDAFHVYNRMSCKRCKLLLLRTEFPRTRPSGGGGKRTSRDQ